MNCIVTIINPESQDLLTAIHEALNLPITDIIYGEGTADDAVRSMLGMDYPRDKRAVITIAGNANTAKLMQAQKHYLELESPGHGVCAVIPLRSVGGRSTLAYLEQTQAEPHQKPVTDFSCELIVCIANSGFTDQVMHAARKGGAKGGTVLHAKGTGSKESSKFYNVTISGEKEVILIIAAHEKRNAIMQAVLKEAGPSSPAGTISFSLPVSETAGIASQFEEL